MQNLRFIAVFVICLCITSIAIGQAKPQPASEEISMSNGLTSENTAQKTLPSIEMRIAQLEVLKEKHKNNPARLAYFNEVIDKLKQQLKK